MPKKHKPSGRGFQARRFNMRDPLQRFLIVCEGEKTELDYFNWFRVPRVVMHIEGLRKDPLTLVIVQE